MAAQIISLNLIYDYPVKWSKYKVLRDFIQNFYDSIGHREWNSRFRYHYNNNELFMDVSDVSFSYEWLVPIGASTKRDGSNSHAGYFGEGFKIAALNALREYNWQVSAGSSDWRIDVTTQEMTIDGRQLKSLAYELERCEKSPNTTLRIRNIWVPEELITSVMLSFFYDGNILFGEKIWEGRDGAVYKRSSVPLPAYSIKTKEFGEAGIVFAAYQNLGSINVPLVFANHRYRRDDRDRKGLYDFDVISLIEKLVSNITAQASATILEYFSNHWYSYPNKRYDVHSFNTIVTNLLRNICQSSIAVNAFRAKHPNLLVADQILKKDIVRSNRRIQARTWKSSSDTHYRLVQTNFKLLGYPTLEDECEKHDGYSLLRQANESEERYIDILELCTKLIFGMDFFGFEKLPQCYIIKNEDAVWRGMANCFPIKKTEKNIYGRKLKYTMDHIAIKSRLLKKGSFAEALSTYLHELCHVFGGDASPNFSRALSDIIELQLRGMPIINVCNEKWDAIIR
jgi:hypothetical protein